MINTLNTSFPQTKNVTTSDIKYYKGKTGVKKIYEECLRSTKIRAYFDPIDLDKVFPENPKLFDETIKKTSGMIVYELVQNSPQAKRSIERSLKTDGHKFKLLPEDIKLTSNDILIYEGKVAIINIGDKENVTGVVGK